MHSPPDWAYVKTDSAILMLCHKKSLCYPNECEKCGS